MHSTLDIELAGERIVLLAQRALLWPARRTVLIADLHLGKDHVFRRSGIPIPSGSTQHDLQRLERIVIEHDVQSLVLLGDFVHAASAADSSHALEFAQWRSRLPSLRFLVVAGNHDRRSRHRELTDCVEWHEDGLRIGPFICRHQHAEDAGGFVLSGHIHPVLRLRGAARQRARVPVCVVSSRHAVLPAFGSFTGGGEIQLSEDERAYAFAADRVWPV